MESILAFIKNNKSIVLLTFFGPLLFTTWLYFDYKEKLASQRTINAYLDSEVFEVRRWLVPIEHLVHLKESLLARMDVAQAVSQRELERINALALLSATPDGVVLQRITARGSNLIVSGIANSSISMEKFVHFVNGSTLCAGGDIVPQPGTAPGSFEIECYVRLEF